MTLLTIRTTARCEMIDITDRVAALVKESGLQDGICRLFVPHTTAAVTINENADPDVPRDILAALDLAYIAAGRFDGFWELKLAPWDTAAGWLLVEEAGGGVTDLRGDPYHLHSKDMLASNGLIHAEMARILAKTDPLFTP